MAARFFYVSSLRLSAAVTVGHPSSVTVNLTHKSSSRGTFSRVFIYHSCTKLLFRGFVFHSLVSDLLNYLPFVKYWPSAHTTSSSHCSIRIALRSAWECILFAFSAGFFFHHKVYWFTLFGGFSCFMISWTQGWGVLFHVYLEGILGISLWKCHVTGHVAFPWSSSVETNL